MVTIRSSSGIALETAFEAVGVPIDGGALGKSTFRHDTWLQVTGSLERHGKRFVVEAERIQPVPTPKEPYLSFRT